MMNSMSDFTPLSSMNPMNSKFDSVDSIVHYLRESSPPEVVSSTTTSSAGDSTKPKSTKRQKKEKDQANLMNNIQTNSRNPIEILTSGRVRYGPITVNPRKQPSKTLFTGRRSKYEVLAGEEEQKRRLRRERNRVAATKCREKRENVLGQLEIKLQEEANQFRMLTRKVQQLDERKRELEFLLLNQHVNRPLEQINSFQEPMVFGNTGFLSSITNTFVPPLPPQQIELVPATEEEELQLLLDQSSVLTNSAYNPDQSNYLLNSQQQQSNLVNMSASSLERIINDFPSPTAFLDNNNNNNTTTCSGLFNSAYGSCAQQHSTSSEDDSMPSTRQNPFVC